MSITVGIFTKTDENGQVDICERWAKPFEKAGFDVPYIPVNATDFEAELQQVDGLLLPGGDSNIHPVFYDLEIEEGDLSGEEERDVERDKAAIALILKAFDMNIPTLGVCRGMQEMIVAFGGQLQKLDFSHINHAAGYAAAQNLDGQRCPKGMDQKVHEITLEKNGFMDGVYEDKTFMVNSIHREGITEKQWASVRNEQLKTRFRIEALAPDGVVEGISARDVDFMMGVQAHFELEGPLHEALFSLFFEKIRAYAQKA